MLRAYKAGIDDGEDPPVPIPNTEVKLTCAEDSQLETACENRQMPAFSLLYTENGDSENTDLVFLFFCSLIRTISSVGRATDS